MAGGALAHSALASAENASGAAVCGCGGVAGVSVVVSSGSAVVSTGSGSVSVPPARRCRRGALASSRRLRSNPSSRSLRIELRPLPGPSLSGVSI